MIYLWTATPGTGKTCYVVKQLVDKWTVQEKYKDRKIYHNINGLKIDGLHKAPDDFRECENGSIIIYDEAQDIDYYSVESKINPVCKALSKHRHRGFDIHFITQDPALLNKWVLKNVYMHYYFWRPAQAKNIEIYAFPRAIVSPTKADFKSAFDKRLWRFETYYLQYYQSTVLNTSEKVSSTKRTSLLVTGFLLFCAIAWFVKPLFGVTSIFSTKQTSQTEQPSNDNDHNQSDNQSLTATQYPTNSLNNLPTEAQDKRVIFENQQFDRKTDLYQKDLPPDYQIRRTDPALQVRGVVKMQNKCLAYNAYGDVMTLSYQECLSYVNTGRVYRSDLVQNSPIQGDLTPQATPIPPTQENKPQTPNFYKIDEQKPASTSDYIHRPAGNS